MWLTLAEQTAQELISECAGLKREAAEQIPAAERLKAERLASERLVAIRESEPKDSLDTKPSEILPAAEGAGSRRRIDPDRQQHQSRSAKPSLKFSQDQIA